MLRFFSRLAVAYALEQLLGHPYKQLVRIERIEGGWRITAPKKWKRLGAPFGIQAIDVETIEEAV